MILHQDFTNMIVAAMPREIYELLSESGAKLCIAGGFCRDVMTGTTPKDIDIFSTNKNAMQTAITIFNWTEDYRSKHTANAKSFIADAGSGKPDVQFISRVFYDDHYEAIQSFDFSICQIGVYYDTDHWVGICTPEYMEDLPEFKMRYTAPARDEDPGASVLRMIKFVSRGYKISEAEIAAVMGRFIARMSKAGETSYDEIRSTELVKKVFRRIGYAGKQQIEMKDEVPF